VSDTGPDASVDGGPAALEAALLAGLVETVASSPGPMRGIGVGDAGVGDAGVRGVGIDVVDLARFRAVLDRRPGLVSRLFTPAEQTYANLVPDPVPRLATRFAAKEATMKALGVGLGAFGFHDAAVVRDGRDAPTLVVTGAAASLAEAAGVGGWHLALTHSDLVAAAVVVAVVRPTAVWL